ncbi:hypothetical protein, partial [Candidatus Hodarchaeum mangrovi]
MIRKVKLSRNLFMLCFIIITITYRLVNLTQHQNNYTIQWTLPKKLMNSPNVTITSPMATTYTSMNITVELNGDAVHFWYYITSIDTINRTWFTSENRVITEDGSYTLHAYGNDSLGDITHVSVSFIIDTLPPIITNLRAYDEAGGNILPENNWHKDTDPLF